MIEIGNYVTYNGLVYRVIAISEDETPTYTLSPIRSKSVALTKTIVTGQKQLYLVPSGGSDLASIAVGDIALIGDRTAGSKAIVDGKVRVQYESNGGSDVACEYIDVDGKATEPIDPTLEGNTFVDWYTESALSNVVDFNATIDDDVTFYAEWLEN